MQAVWKVTQDGIVEQVGEYNVAMAQNVARGANVAAQAVGPVNFLYVVR